MVKASLKVGVGEVAPEAELREDVFLEYEGVGRVYYT